VATVNVPGVTKVKPAGIRAAAFGSGVPFNAGAASPARVARAAGAASLPCSTRE
jgi:hypothetical protein